MKQEIVIRGASGQPVTTTLAIAAGTEVTHEAVIKLVRTHLAPLQQFGEVRFEIRLNPQGSGTEFAVLNEQQSALVIAFMRNSDVVVAFKVALVKGFFDMRAALAAPAIAAPVKPSIAAPAKEFRALFSLGKLIGLAPNAAAISANQAVAKLTGTNILELLGQTHLIADQRGQTFTPTELGKERGISGLAMNRLLAECCAQEAKNGNWAPTDLGAPHCEWLDTGKKHSGGTPIKQLKWFASVCDLLQK